ALDEAQIKDILSMLFDKENVDISEYSEEDFGMAFIKLSEEKKRAMLMEMGYSKEQIDSILDSCKGNKAVTVGNSIGRTLIEKIADKDGNKHGRLGKTGKASTLGLEGIRKPGQYKKYAVNTNAETYDDNAGSFGRASKETKKEHEEKKKQQNAQTNSTGQAISKPKMTEYEEDFTSRYNVDDETMTVVENWIEDYRENGNTDYINAFQRYQNLSEEEWQNLSEEEYKEFTALAVLFAWAGYVVEHSSEGTTGYEVYREICEQCTAELYSRKSVTGESELEIATVDDALVSTMDTALTNLGASDSLAFNIVSKVKMDSNGYYITPQQGVIVQIADFEEGDYVTVSIKDSRIFDDIEQQTNEFLAIGRDNAALYFDNIRASASGYSNHSMTDDELIKMLQVVENPDDLRIMTNIAISDADYKINGDGNAFIIDYWEDDTSNNWKYKKGISDLFSMALAQMGSTILYRQDLEGYRQLVNATVLSSINGSNHNILLDMASGAGTYVDLCIAAILNDAEGDENDEELKKMLNAANANFGSFSMLYEKMAENVTFSDIRISDIDYDENTGYIDYNIQADTKEGVWIFGESQDDRDIQIHSEIKSGNSAIVEREEDIQDDLKKELDRKRDSIIIDCVIDLIGCYNPVLKDAIQFTKATMTSSNSTTNSMNIVRDGIKAMHADSKNFNLGYAAGTTLLGALSKYNTAVAAYNKAKKESTDTELLTTYFSYNKGSKTVGLYDYDSIRLLQNWDRRGIRAVADVNEYSLYFSLREGSDGAEYSKAVVKTIGEFLTDNVNFDSLGPNGNGDAGAGFELIKKHTGYSENDIDCAIKLLTFGDRICDEDDPYHEINDIPYDLMMACVHAITTNTDVDLYRCLEDYIDDTH
ncbi:hypothetical protein, partial [Butyrivibrio fibrisolvens]|uniref:hypothetical protein n=1 Tax=Butyrivibrio fibrisolvens TaxID=831 RepID=UPI000553EF90